MAGKPRTGCKVVVDGQMITPEWLVEHKGMRYSTAVRKIYEYLRGAISTETLLHCGHPGSSAPSMEWRSLQDEYTRPLRCPGPGSWERKFIPDDGRVGVCKAGRPQGNQDETERPAYYHGQFSVSLR